MMVGENIELVFEFCNIMADDDEGVCAGFWSEIFSLNWKISIFIGYQDSYIDYNSYEEPLVAQLSPLF